MPLVMRAADVTVRFAHAIRVTAQPQREDRHAKRVRTIDARLAEREKFVKRDAQFPGEIAEIFSHHVAGKRIIAGRHRSMRGENVRRGDNLKPGIKIKPLLDNI